MRYAEPEVRQAARPTNEWNSATSCGRSVMATFLRTRRKEGEKRGENKGLVDGRQGQQPERMGPAIVGSLNA
jgi:hypothetical protein